MSNKRLVLIAMTLAASPAYGGKGRGRPLAEARINTSLALESTRAPTAKNRSLRLGPRPIKLSAPLASDRRDNSTLASLKKMASEVLRNIEAPAVSEDDLVQEGLLTLLELDETYSTRHSTQSPISRTSAYGSVRSAMLKAARRAESSDDIEVRIDQSASQDPLELLLRAEALRPIDVDNKRYPFTPQEIRIFKLYTKYGLTFEEIGKLQGWGKGRVRGSYTKTLHRLRILNRKRLAGELLPTSDSDAK